jgi:AcrR family transcriptional regulator
MGYFDEIIISRNLYFVNMEKRGRRMYRMTNRAAAHEETRERIVRATMTLHDERGVATTSFADIAERAGVGPATVSRHFPTLGALVMACGGHVAAEMRPPSPGDAPLLFQGLATTRARLERLVSELDAFYARGSLRLIKAANDRDRVPELDQFLISVDAGIEALIKEAVADEAPSRSLIGVLMALCSVSVWHAMQRAELAEADRQATLVDILASAIAAVRSRRRSRS